jgi:excisionase family DNA binding protein
MREPTVKEALLALGEAIERELAARPVAPPAAGLSITEAAAMLGISRATLERRIQRGEVTIRRLGRRVIVPRAEVERLLGPRP